MTIEQQYIFFTMYKYAKEEYDNYVKQHGEMYPFTMERQGVMKAYRNVIEVLHLTEVYEHFEQELNTAMSPAWREQQEPEEECLKRALNDPERQDKEQQRKIIEGYFHVLS